MCEILVNDCLMRMKIETPSREPRAYLYFSNTAQSPTFINCRSENLPEACRLVYASPL